MRPNSRRPRPPPDFLSCSIRAGLRACFKQASRQARQPAGLGQTGQRKPRFELQKSRFSLSVAAARDLFLRPTASVVVLCEARRFATAMQVLGVGHNMPFSPHRTVERLFTRTKPGQPRGQPGVRITFLISAFCLWCPAGIIAGSCHLAGWTKWSPYDRPTRLELSCQMQMRPGKSVAHGSERPENA